MKCSSQSLMGKILQQRLISNPILQNITRLLLKILSNTISNIWNSCKIKIWEHPTWTWLVHNPMVTTTLTLLLAKSVTVRMIARRLFRSKWKTSKAKALSNDHCLHLIHNWNDHCWVHFSSSLSLIYNGGEILN